MVQTCHILHSRAFLSSGECVYINSLLSVVFASPVHTFYCLKSSYNIICMIPEAIANTYMHILFLHAIHSLKYIFIDVPHPLGPSSYSLVFLAPFCMHVHVSTWNSNWLLIIIKFIVILYLIITVTIIFIPLTYLLIILYIPTYLPCLLYFHHF